MPQGRGTEPNEMLNAYVTASFGIAMRPQEIDCFFEWNSHGELSINHIQVPQRSIPLGAGGADPDRQLRFLLRLKQAMYSS